MSEGTLQLVNILSTKIFNGNQGIGEPLKSFLRGVMKSKDSLQRECISKVRLVKTTVAVNFYKRVTSQFWSLVGLFQVVLKDSGEQTFQAFLLRALLLSVFWMLVASVPLGSHKWGIWSLTPDYWIRMCILTRLPWWFTCSLDFEKHFLKKSIYFWIWLTLWNLPLKFIS